MSVQSSTVLEGKAQERGDLLRRTLQVNGAALLLGGAALTLGSAALASEVAIPGWVLLPAGIAFVGEGIAFTALAARASLLKRLGQIVLLNNVTWVVFNTLLVLSGWLALTTVGAWVLIAMALLLGAFAVAQWLGLRRLTA